MKILFLGDIMGRSGRDAVVEKLASLKKTYQADVAIVNAENAASGAGITQKLAQELFDAGADCLTMGNHVWGQRELLLRIDDMPRLVRPLNLRAGTPGKGYSLITLAGGQKILVVNLLGRLFMDNMMDDPFACLESLLEDYRLGHTVHAIFVDFHAEATSEKVSMGHIFDGRVSAVVGTHTHIPTADETILPHGTGYLTDAGMCGDYNSVIGVRTDIAIWKFQKSYPGERMVTADGPATLCGIVITIDDRTGLAQHVERIQIKPN